MNNSMFRFSRDKRLSIPVAFGEFLDISNKLLAVVCKARPWADVKVLTCEDEMVYQYSTVSFASDEVDRVLEKCRLYPLADLSKDLWDRSLSVQVALHDMTDPKPFMICLSCDRKSERSRMLFSGQCAGEELYSRIQNMFAQPSLAYAIGNDYRKSSVFNLAVGQRVTGISLFK